MRFLLNLYPAAWRARYGDEVEALMSDARVGWRGAFDLIWGAMRMRLRLGSDVGIVASFCLVGILVSLGLWYVKRPGMGAKAVVQITQTGATDNNAVVSELSRRAEAALTSPAFLTELIQDPRLNLYPGERRARTMETLLERMRRDVAVRIMSDRHGPSRSISIQFICWDKEKAVLATNLMIGRLMRAASSGPVNWTGTTHWELAQRSRVFGERRAGIPKVAKVAIGAGAFVGALIGIVVLCLIRIFQTEDLQASRPVSTLHA